MLAVTAWITPANMDPDMDPCTTVDLESNKIFNVEFVQIIVLSYGAGTSSADDSGI